MKRLFFSLVAILVAITTQAQNVGVGLTTGIDARLHVAKADSGLLLLHNTTAFDDSLKSRLYFKTGNRFTGGIGTHVESGDGFRARLGFFSYSVLNAGGLREHMVITDDGNVGIGTVRPNPNALLEINSANKGLLLPRLTTPNLTGMVSPPDGMLAYNQTDDLLYLRKNGAWRKLVDETSSSLFNLAYAGSASTTGKAFSITNTATGTGGGIYGKASGTGAGVEGASQNGAGVVGTSVGGNGGEFYAFNNGAAGYFQTSGSTSLVTIGGNAGINTLSPQFPLDVNGRMRLRSNPGLSAGLWLNNLDNSGQTGFIGTNDNSTLGFYGNAGAGWGLLMNSGSGHVGIGAGNLHSPLTFGNGTGNKISLYGNSVNSQYGIGIQGYLMQFYTDAASADIAFGYGSSNFFTENMRIKGNGYVGINKTNPSTWLDVSGKIKATEVFGDDAAIEVAGAIKVSGSNKAAFQVYLTVPGSNYFQINSGGTIIDYYKITTPMTANDPTAIIVATPISTVLSYPFWIGYDANNSIGGGNGQWYLAEPRNNGVGGFINGMRFNVMIMKQ